MKKKAYIKPNIKTDDTCESCFVCLSPVETNQSGDGEEFEPEAKKSLWETTESKSLWDDCFADEFVQKKDN